MVAPALRLAPRPPPRAGNRSPSPDGPLSPLNPAQRPSQSPQRHTCCLLSWLKTFAIPARNHRSPAFVNVSERFCWWPFSGVHQWPVLGVHRGQHLDIFAPR